VGSRIGATRRTDAFRLTLSLQGNPCRECFIPRGERRDRSRWSRLTYAAAYFCLFAPIFFSWAKRVRFYDQRYDVAFYLNKEIVDRAMDAQIKVKAAKQFLTDEEMGYTPDVLTDEEMGYTPPPRRTR
jgi:hypothetical protein